MTDLPTPVPTIFTALVGADHVLTSTVDRVFYSHDIIWPFTRSIADAVVRPGTVDELAAVVRAATSNGIAVFPRGGGYTYTGCYSPDRNRSIVLDLQRLDRIVEIDAINDSVTVEAGVTWGKLFDALDAKGLRVPSFGPLSGYGATVGGSASTDASFFGSASYGAIGDHVLDLDVVAADGRIVKSAGNKLFVGDCGALGVKARVTLRTIKRPGATVFASFAFADAAGWANGLIALKGLPGLGEAFGFDPGTHRNLTKTGFSVLESTAIAGDLLRARGNWFDKLSGLVRTARAGKAFIADLQYSLHLAIDGADEAAAQASRDEAGRILAGHGGELIPDVIPRVTRSRPFRPVKSFLGPDGENWMPVNAILPLANGAAAVAAIETMVKSRRDALDHYGIRTTILTLLTKDKMIVEPQIFWPDRLNTFHRRMGLPDMVAAHGEDPENRTARMAAHALRDVMRETLDRFDAAHYQIGRYYQPEREPNQAARRALKAELDPKRLINPGVLGL
ncbi:MAG: FAD-binding oxidoreductase [Alphaproteobacteria bacterium]